MLSKLTKGAPELDDELEEEEELEEDAPDDDELDDELEEEDEELDEPKASLPVELPLLQADSTTIDTNKTTVGKARSTKMCVRLLIRTPLFIFLTTT